MAPSQDQSGEDQTPKEGNQREGGPKGSTSSPKVSKLIDEFEKISNEIDQTLSDIKIKYDKIWKDTARKVKEYNRLIKELNKIDPNSPEWQEKKQIFESLENEINEGIKKLKQIRQQLKQEELKKSGKTASSSQPDSEKEDRNTPSARKRRERKKREAPPAAQPDPETREDSETSPTTVPDEIQKRIDFIKNANEILRNERIKFHLLISRIMGSASWFVYGVGIWLALWSGMYLAGPAGAIITVRAMHRYLSHIRHSVKDRYVELDVNTAERYKEMGKKGRAKKILEPHVKRLREKLDKRHGNRRKPWWSWFRGDSRRPPGRAAARSGRPPGRSTRSRRERSREGGRGR